MDAWKVNLVPITCLLSVDFRQNFRYTTVFGKLGKGTVCMYEARQQKLKMQINSSVPPYSQEGKDTEQNDNVSR